MENSEKFYYLLYIILNFLCYILVIISQLKSIISLSLSFHIVQIISSSLSLFFLRKTRNKPGYIDKNVELEDTDIKDVKNDTNLEYSPIVYYNLMPNNGCEKCQITKLPLRSHHCPKCEKCVKSFDHHCWILAGCVGENNRFMLIIFLFFQNISIIYSAYGVIKIMNRQSSELLIYILTLLFSVNCLFEIIFIFVFIYHIYLLANNQTTYELFNEDQCPYLSIFTLERKKILGQRGIVISENIRFRPFDGGFIKNFSLYFKKMFNSEYSIKWNEIYFENLRTNYINLNCGDRAILNLNK